MSSRCPQGDFAEALAGEALQEVAPFFDGSGGSCAYVLLKELPRSVVCYGGSSTSLPGRERFSSVGESGVTLDRGEGDTEESGSLGLGGTALVYGLDYLLA